MKMFTSRSARCLARTALVLGTTLSIALIAGGCMGHGKVTGEHLNAAKLRMAQMKSATEWTMGHQAFLAGDLDKAEKHIGHSIELNGEVLKSHILLGRIHLEKSEFEPAGKCFQKAEELDPKSAEACYYLGLLAERIDRHEDALTRYKAAGELDSANAQYPIAAAEVLITLGRIDEAQTFLETMQANFEHSPGVRQTLGHIAVLKNDHAKALTLFHEARLLAPDNQQIAEDLITAQISVRQYAQAEMSLARLLTNSKNAERRDLFKSRADCLIALNRPVEARDVLVQLTKDNSGEADFEAWASLGQVAYVLKDINRLKSAASRVTAIAPDRSEGYVLKGLELKTRGDSKGAIQQFQRALEIERSSDTLILLGVTLQEMGEEQLARSCFAAAAKENPTDTAAAKLLAALPPAPGTATE